MAQYAERALADRQVVDLQVGQAVHGLREQEGPPGSTHELRLAMQTATDITASNVLPARLPKGFVLEGYVVDGWLRDGGMAAIYRAHRASNDHRVALKLQLPSTAHDPAICERFDREAELMRRAKGSDHVVELFDAGVLDDERRYLVMEWVEGEDLEELLDFSRNQDQRLQIARACRIGRDIARGLAELHGHGVVHLDLKPANVMVGKHEGEADRIMLVDFGIAADLRERGDDGELLDGAAPMGTSSYMSPQQARGDAPEPSFDLYALGVLMFEILSGTRLPPDGWSPETLPRLESLRRGVPRELADLVRACMDLDPLQRPASAGVVVAALVQTLRSFELGDLRRRESAEDVPVRSGGTEIVPQSAVRTGPLAAAAPVRTGETEVMLTHEEVLSRSGLAPALPLGVVSSARRLEVQGPKYEPVRRSWVKWGVLAGVVVLVGAWLVAGGLDGDGGEGHGGGDSPQSAQQPAAEISVAPTLAEAKSSPADPSVRGPETQPLTGDDIGAGEADEDEPPSDAAVEASAERPVAVPLEPDMGSADNLRSKPNKPAKATNSPTKQACDAMQSMASDAKKARAWKIVLQATSKRGCWGSSELRLERTRLRVAAHAELRDYAKCVKEGGKSQDADITARTSYCKKKLDGGGKATANPWQ